MKKALSLILVLVLMLSLCACGKGGQQNADASTGGTTAESTNGQTDGATQATSGTENETPTTGDTNKETTATEPAGTTATQPAGTTATEPAGTTATEPAPTTCSHTFSEATCAAPKTCTKCGVTEGGKGDHTYTPDCAICGQPNEGYVELGQSSWSYTIKGDGKLTQCSYDFFDSVADQGVNVSYTVLTSLEKFSQEWNMTIDEIRAEYTPMEMIKTIDGVEYVYDGWGMDNWSSRRYKEENGVVTVEFLSLDWDDNDNEVWTVKHTVVMKRTGMAEMTVTSSDYEDTPVGTKLTGEYFGS